MGRAVGRSAGGTIYYRTQGSGPALVLIGGGPSNASTLGTLAGHLAIDRTVIGYDRRGNSRSRLDDRSQPARFPSTPSMSATFSRT
ncbi:MAG: alpha/beta hydrolase [Solirubrobacteraceae bacterium]